MHQVSATLVHGLHMGCIWYMDCIWETELTGINTNMNGRKCADAETFIS